MWKDMVLLSDYVMFDFRDFVVEVVFLFLEVVEDFKKIVEKF